MVESPIPPIHRTIRLF
jgi:hypothetical protein